MTPAETPTPPAAPVPATSPGWMLPALVAMGLLSVAALGLAWQSRGEIQSLEQELVRRQDSSRRDAEEARALARQAQAISSDGAAKQALMEARLAEVALQRGQLEELIQSMSRSRDENVIVDIESSIHVAMQQSAITGSAEPLVATLHQADERLLRYKQPRMEGVRRAVARDLDRVKAVTVVDVATLAIRLDEVVRLIDELPLLSTADKSSEAMAARQARASNKSQAAKPGAKPVSMPDAASDAGWEGWWAAARQRMAVLGGEIWSEARSLLRVTRIDHPEAMLVAPEQTFFLRENLKLRLLNARLALLSRQYETAQIDLRESATVLDRYFDGRARKVVVASDLLRQVAGQARQVNVPRPDDTLAALAAAGAGR